jgi:hypothetical protein
MAAVLDIKTPADRKPFWFVNVDRGKGDDVTDAQDRRFTRVVRRATRVDAE